MSHLMHLKLSFERHLRTKPSRMSTVIAEALPERLPVEEECSSSYSPNHFYPVRLGEIFNERYQVVAKLGFSSNSTIWLAKDLHQWRWRSARYVAVKVNANPDDVKSAAEREFQVSQLLQGTKSRLVNSKPAGITGHQYAHILQDYFNLNGPHGVHFCTISDPLGESLEDLKQRLEGRIPLNLLKAVTRMILRGLEFLHAECLFIHTDLKPESIRLTLGRWEPQAVARAERKTPRPQKKLEDRTIYTSRQAGDLNDLVRVVITDFGASVAGNDCFRYEHLIQSLPYRAPEVIIGAGWSYGADIWNLGVMIWDLLEGKNPFDSISSMNAASARKHLARLIGFLGHPPNDLLARGSDTHRYFDDKGNFLSPELIPESVPWEGLLSRVQGNEKAVFLDFIRRMLCWRPGDRSSAEELLLHPWTSQVKTERLIGREWYH
ncbi:CMGC/SRPK protein kinase [Coccidioides immitis RS]|uniref:non-specific serine/threonine protein kinase n=1 Tax=Coccidioides immitis (strain RS) TaxID=246410 RepID=J3KDK7_COCIM|nr:CMGC/SRPK protein kinase [Coccidioides immitis RS]EAS33460.3 CMGC/SRPK protein kinase [Coccidioides immitis RS]